MDVIVFYPILWKDEDEQIQVFARDDKNMQISILFPKTTKTLKSLFSKKQFVPHAWFSLNDSMPSEPLGLAEKGYRGRIENLTMTNLDNQPFFRILSWVKISDEDITMTVSSRNIEEKKIMRMNYFFGEKNRTKRGFVPRDYRDYIPRISEILHIDAEFYDGKNLTEAPLKFKIRECLTCDEKARNPFEFFIDILEKENQI